MNVSKLKAELEKLIEKGKGNVEVFTGKLEVEGIKSVKNVTLTVNKLQENNKEIVTIN
jgi:hypothetical protein